MTERLVRGIRGATSVGENTREAILSATRGLLLAMQAANGFRPEGVVTAFFTLTPDLDAAFPAAAARELGWDAVPLFGAQEVAVPGTTCRCVRILVQVYTDREARAIQHLYLGEAAALRPDLP